MYLEWNKFRKRAIKLIWICVLIFLLSSLVPSTRAGTESKFDSSKVDAYIEQAMDRLGIPGASVGIVRGKTVLYTKGYGTAGPGQGPVTPQTPFVLGSTSKSVTAMAVMQLVDKKEIELNAPVQRYLPWFRLADETASAKITVRHLLEQTSGLSTYEGQVTLVSDDIPLQDFIRKMKDVPLAAPVGFKYQYCNLNYAILGGVVEAVSRQTFGDYVKEHIFKPLKMSHSTAYASEARAYGLASGYQSVFGMVVPTFRKDRVAGVPDGSLISSAEDMTHYLIAQMNGGRYKERSVLPPDRVREMHQPYAYTGDQAYYGMGWGITDKRVEHSGSTENTSSYLTMEGEYGIVLLLNSADSIVSYDEVPLGVLKLLKGQEPNVEDLPSMKRTHLRIVLFLILVVITTILPLKWMFGRKRNIDQEETVDKARNRWRTYAVKAGIAIVYLVIPVAVLIGFPKLMTPWSVAFAFQPGISHFMVIYSFILLSIGVLNIVLWVRKKS
ncbi:serine hydrolase domain-containing protein [Paenibacillus tuaregi]|uniref:serine hydrolase domain-containing protein n=1 Tax=Paenibacillus tuaregi TaxID=1816681 RepID=UPI0008388CDF|nr:serine hydrolase domain-containing protein [Paenibacillus tuaregi]